MHDLYKQRIAALFKAEQSAQYGSTQALPKAVCTYDGNNNACTMRA
jgi:hypothetical protein